MKRNTKFLWLPLKAKRSIKRWKARWNIKRTRSPVLRSLKLPKAKSTIWSLRTSRLGIGKNCIEPS